MTNDGHPITHESTGFGITSTWPHPGLTGLRYRVRVYPPFTGVRPPSPRGPRRCQDRSRGKNAITARLSYCLPLTFRTESMNIYESILILHLPPPPSFCLLLKTPQDSAPSGCVFILNPAAARVVWIIHPNESFPFFITCAPLTEGVKVPEAPCGQCWACMVIWTCLQTETGAWPRYIWLLLLCFPVNLAEGVKTPQLPACVCHSTVG